MTCEVSRWGNYLLLLKTHFNHFLGGALKHGAGDCRRQSIFNHFQENTKMDPEVEKSRFSFSYRFFVGVKAIVEGFQTLDTSQRTLCLDFRFQGLKGPCVLRPKRYFSKTGL